jgi:glutathione S-transferase
VTLKLIVGNKNYSSWSLRPWIAMRAAGIPFDEEVIPLYLPGSREKILAYSPAGKVPVLIDGGVHVWDSLAIMEYLAEKFPDKGLWPRDRRARALARSISAEMHSGFAALRQHCTMNLWLPPKPRSQPPEVMADVSRIETIWREARAQFGKGGPFLFGAFGAADAMYAPVVGRFHNYGLPVSDDTRAYMDAVRASPAWIEWKEASMKEPWVIQHNEVDWPVVERV